MINLDSFIKWYGGKSLLRNTIIPMIPAHKTYTEVFGGACWVLFGKPISPVEIINDIDNDLIRLYLAIKYHLDEFLNYLEDIPISEVLFNKWVADRQGIPALRSPDVEKVVEVSGIPLLPGEIEDSCKFYYLLINAFNGKMAGIPYFSSDKDRGPPFVKFYKTDWQEIRNRLMEVTILNRDYSEIIVKFDDPKTFFYLDAPYTVATGNKNYYRYTFSRQDHEDLAVYLSDIAGKFILSYDNVPDIIDRYRDFNIKVVNDKEILIYNYDLPDPPFYICREGIPDLAGKSESKTAWFNPNCPYCGSRNVKTTYERVTLPGNKRNWPKAGMICKDCNRNFDRSESDGE